MVYRPLHIFRDHWRGTTCSYRADKPIRIIYTPQWTTLIVSPFWTWLLHGQVPECVMPKYPWRPDEWITYKYSWPSNITLLIWNRLWLWWPSDQVVVCTIVLPSACASFDWGVPQPVSPHRAQINAHILSLIFFISKSIVYGNIVEIS